MLGQDRPERNLVDRCFFGYGDLVGMLVKIFLDRGSCGRWRVWCRTWDIAM
jgi:hypothetical protein